MAVKPKRSTTGLDLKTFKGKGGETYLVFRTGKEFHVFTEVEAKEAARQCGATKEKNTQSMWKEVWSQS